MEEENAEDMIKKERLERLYKKLFLAIAIVAFYAIIKLTFIATKDMALDVAINCEFELSESPEAKLAKALDNLEVQIQHNHADFSSWEEIEYDLVYNKMDTPCSHDSFLKELCDAVKSQAEDKMQKNGVDGQSIKLRVENTQ